MPESRGVVLVVESDDLLRRLLVDLVARTGFVPAPATSWARGMQLCTARAAELVGVVLGLHGSDGVDGVELLGSLRDLVPGLPCVFVCASGSGGHTHTELLALGRTAVFDKPFLVARFQERIEQLLGTD